MQLGQPALDFSLPDLSGQIHRLSDYRGAFDDVTFRQRAATRSYLKDAVEALLAGRNPDLAETAPYGCTIVRHIP